MIARAALALLAVVAIVVSGIWLSDRASGISARQTLLNPKSSPAELRQGIQQAKDSRTLNPSTDPDLTRYGLLLRLGRNAEARTVFESIVRREPDSRNAWTFLAVTSQSTNPAQFRRALEHLHRLSPLTEKAP
jgi:tetratricopeptide repeat protein